mmetsp:Transcript_38660/g.68660  ORF Transcript_38660/g.68660 Transcript_38660/m.68660 type:complete len:398 (+) Transcript_38660:49-1242(+)
MTSFHGSSDRMRVERFRRFPQQAPAWVRTAPWADPGPWELDELSVTSFPPLAAARTNQGRRARRGPILPRAARRQPTRGARISSDSESSFSASSGDEQNPWSSAALRVSWLHEGEHEPDVPDLDITDLMSRVQTFSLSPRSQSSDASVVQAQLSRGSLIVEVLFKVPTGLAHRRHSAELLHVGLQILLRAGQEVDSPECLKHASASLANAWLGISRPAGDASPLRTRPAEARAVTSARSPTLSPTQKLLHDVHAWQAANDERAARPDTLRSAKADGQGRKLDFEAASLVHVPDDGEIVGNVDTAAGTMPIVAASTRYGKMAIVHEASAVGERESRHSTPKVMTTLSSEHSRSERRRNRALGSSEPGPGLSKVCRTCGIFYGGRAVECPTCGGLVISI